ncbi:MAG TPA: hypothetical protein VGI19_02145 [Candidatus Cybelea sp.]|jgi:hypothetical protein
MTLKKISRIHYAIGLLAAGALAAGCNGPASSLNSPGQAAQANHVRPMAGVSTRVVIFNGSQVEIAGSSVGSCWTVSPLPLPKLTKDQYSGIETLTFNPVCVGGGPSVALDITYGPIAGAEPCTFETTYNGRFAYKVINGSSTACTATPSKSLSYDELFTYASAGSLNRRH